MKRPAVGKPIRVSFSIALVFSAFVDDSFDQLLLSCESVFP